MSNKKWLGIKENLLEPFIDWFGKHPLAVFITILLGIGTFLITIYSTINSHIESTAQAAVLNQSFLSGLSAKIRPTIVFDSNETTIASSGMEVLADYEVEPLKGEAGPGPGFVVRLRFNEFQKSPPIVTCLDGSLYVTKSESHKNNWLFVVSTASKGPMPLLNQESFSNAVFRFKVELIP